ncbi:MAG: hypothetical protein CMD92_08045 [Gammaproteobacteria bacterium]|nr:hypothetical protein [Gammaproteobacteria bacterium]
MLSKRHEHAHVRSHPRVANWVHLCAPLLPGLVDVVVVPCKVVVGHKALVRIYRKCGNQITASVGFLSVQSKGVVRVDRQSATPRWPRHAWLIGQVVPALRGAGVVIVHAATCSAAPHIARLCRIVIGRHLLLWRVDPQLAAHQLIFRTFGVGIAAVWVQGARRL